MINTSRLQAAEQHLTSREIPVTGSTKGDLKTALSPPEKYLSDLIVNGNYKSQAFCLKLDRFYHPGDLFLCLALDCPPVSGAADDCYRAGVEQAIFSVFQDRGGPLSWLTDTVLVTAVSHGDVETMEQLPFLVQKALMPFTGTPAPMGAANFPLLDFSRQDTFFNALRALDHAGFYPNGTLIFPTAATFNISGDRRYHQHHIAAAMHEYRLGLRLDPEDTNLINSLGVCCSITHRFDEALPLFETAARAMPQDPLILYNAGLICNLTDQLQKGCDYLNRAIELDKCIFEVQLTAGVLAAKMGNADKALHHLGQAAKIDPASGVALGFMGDIYLDRGDYPSAGKAYQRAIKCNPRDSWAMSGLARTYEIQNTNMDIALSLAAQSVALTPEISLFQHRLGRIQLKKGNYEAASAAFSRSAELAADPFVNAREAALLLRSGSPALDSRRLHHDRKTAREHR